MNLQNLNDAPLEAAAEQLERCCGSRHWCEQLLAKRPFADQAELLAQSEKIWYNLERADWLEAFLHHPKIGDVNSLREKYANTKQWAAGEQSGVDSAAETTIAALAAGNSFYEQKFGYIFIVCASGKSAEQMLVLLTERLTNEPEREIRVAMEEQNKITKLRLEKLLA